MFKANKRLLAVAIACSLGVSAPTFAGNNDGSIRVSVMNPEKSPLAGSTVVLTNNETGYTKTIQADDDGNLRIGGLPIGRYSVKATKNGYDDAELGEISVQLGQETKLNITLQASGYEKIEVTGSVVAAFDVTSSESALNIDSVELARLPIPRSVDSVALLAPGTTQGDSRFGGTSFGGSSVAENQMYINGLNVTNFRNGLGFSSVPYDFYDQFQVKTGGYSAEFGRSTGGVINAVTKSGSNEFKMGASVYSTPGSLRANSPSVKSNDGDYLVYNEADEYSTLKGNIWASGALVKDKLFFYAIYAPEKIEDNYSTRSSSDKDYEEDTDNDFWGLKLDWNINDNNRLEFLAFNDASTEYTDTYTVNSDDSRTYGSTAHEKSGGKNWSLKYTGYITDDLTISALYGRNKYDMSEGSNLPDECEYIRDYRYYSQYPVYNVDYVQYYMGCATSSDYAVEVAKDEREAIRLDAEWVINSDHVLRFGLDREVNTSLSEEGYAGPNGSYWIVYSQEAGLKVNGVTLDSNTDYIYQRERTVGGSFETINSAFYLEDTWTISDTVTATIGLRNEQFNNKNSEGATFAKIDDMLAPRLGISWDINGDGESKLFANIGRYFLPVANNTNVRLAGNEYDVKRYYVLEGWDTAEASNGTSYYTPILGDQIGNDYVAADGSVPDTRSVVDADLDPMFQDELILGYESMGNLLGEDLSYGVKFTYRSLNGAIDDMIIDHAIREKFGCDADYEANQYVLGNPGKEMTVYTDTDCDGEVDDWATFSADELQYPEAERKYLAWDFTVGRQWDGVWSLRATYTWSHSFGNTEGLVKSDNGQDDAGLTTDFDFPQLMDGSYGNLPNDRRHNIKVFGALALTEDLMVGFNYSLASGRPINYFGTSHPDYYGEDMDYGYTYYEAVETDGEYEYIYHPRGSMGTTPWISRLDLNMTYNLSIGELDTTFKVDVFNVLNSHKATRVYEVAETSIAAANADYLKPLAFQTPRYVQLSASVEF